MSIAEFYLDYGLDAEDPDHMNKFLAAYAPGGGGGGGGDDDDGEYIDVNEEP
jgi:hypothetical protein